MTLRDTHYQHWDGQHQGIWHRRWVIAANTLTACFQLRWMRHIVTTCWLGSLVIVALLFIIGQLLVADSIVVQWVANFSAQLQAFTRNLTSWLEDHPEVSVRTTYDLLFFFASSFLLTTSFIAISIAVPLLITRDLSSNAILVYSSKAVSRMDYLLGKFGAVFGLVVLTWLGPLCVAWFAGNLVSPHWHFFWHSRVALWHILLFALSGAVVLCILALGTSALSPNTRTSAGLWVAFWLLGDALVPIAFGTRTPWLNYFSFSYDLQQISLSIFHLQDDFDLARSSIPMFNMVFSGARRPGPWSVFGNSHLSGAVMGLGVMVILAVFVIRRKVKAE